MAEKKNILDWLFSTENNPAETKEIKITRLSKAYGQDVIFKIKGLGFNEICHYREMQDDAKRQLGIVLAGLMEPNFKDKDAYRAAGFKSAEEAIRAKLLPGEISMLASEIAKLTGYGVTVGEEIEKNSESATA